MMTGKYDGILICSDFDGTLFWGGKISEENAAAIRYFQENGGRFTITSGRYPAFLGKYRQSVEANTYLIGLNGTIISSYDGTSILRQGFLNKGAGEIVKKIIHEADEIAAMSFSTTEIPDVIKKHCEAPDGEGYFRYLIGQHDEELLEIALSCNIHRIIFHTKGLADRAIAERLQKIAGDAYAISRSYERGIEIQDVAHTKGTCARYLANHLGAHTLVCVGDYENDISMIKEADIGYAVANACESLKSVADRITNEKVGGAIAEIIYSL